MKSKRHLFLFFLILFLIHWAHAQDNLPFYLTDRGHGLATSMFGTYITEGQIILYPFYEFYYDKDAEYGPVEFGYELDADFRGLFRAHEGLVYFAYGLSDYFALEIEAAYISAEQHKSKDDPTAMPNKIKESGIGDVESQLRWRWNKETESSPEIFSYFETVFPLQKRRQLIGTQEWEFKLGSGLVKGFRWGTMSIRLAFEYVTEENKVEFGEYAVEYLKRVSDFFRFYIGIEGSQDEIEFITDFQFSVFKNGFIRINNAFGMTSKVGEKL